MESQEMTNRLGTEKLGTLMVRLSLPAILSMVTAAVYNLADRIFVGRMNPLGLTAIGITMPFQIMQMAFVLMIGIGSATLISIECGRGDRDKAQRLLNTAFWYFIGMQTLVTVLGIVFMDQLFHLLKVSQEVYPYAREYTWIILLGGVPGLTGYCLNNSVRALGHARSSMIYVMVSSGLNILLDAWFVWELGWGVKGAAAATVLSQTLVTVFVLRFFFQNPIAEEGRGGKLFFLSAREFGRNLAEITVNGIPNFCMQLFGTVVNISLNQFIISYGGDYQMASVTIIASLSQFFLMVIYGIGQGIQPILGFNHGAGKQERVKACLMLALKFGVGLMLLILLLIQLIPQVFISLFTEDQALIQMTVHNARIYLSMLPLVAVHSMGTTFLQSVKKPRVTTILYILRYGGILLPALLILPGLLGIDGVYLSHAVSDGISGLAAAGAIGYFLAKEKKTGQEAAEEATVQAVEEKQTNE